MRQALLFLGSGHLFGVPMPIFVFAICAIVVHLFLSRTSTGRFIYSQGDNPEAARLAGIALRPLIVLEYMIVAFLAWIAGLVWVGTTGSIQMAVVQGTYVFDVILVVVLGGISLIGGRGSVFSVVVGCALIGTLLNAFTIMDVNSEVQNIIRGVRSARRHHTRQLAASARRGDGAPGRLTSEAVEATNTIRQVNREDDKHVAEIDSGRRRPWGSPASR